MSKNKIISITAVLLMLSVTFSVSMGGILDNDMNNLYVSADNETNDTARGYAVSGIIEVGGGEVAKFSDLKIVLRDHTKRENYTTYVGINGEYSFSNIPYINDEYGLYVFGGNHTFFNTVNLDYAENNIFVMDTILLNGRGQANGSTNIAVVYNNASNFFNLTYQLYPEYNVATVSMGGFSGTNSVEDLVFPEVIEYERSGKIEKYAVTSISGNLGTVVNNVGAKSVTFPFGVSDMSSTTFNSTAYVVETIFIPSTVSDVSMSIMGSNTTVKNIIFEEGSPFHIDNQGIIYGGSLSDFYDRYADRPDMLNRVLVKIPNWPNPVPATVQSIAAGSDTEITLVEGHGAMLRASVNSDAYNQTIRWYSDNSEIATVVGGWVRAVSLGETTVFAVSGENSEKVIEYKITVEEAAKTHPESIVLDKKSITFFDSGETITLNVELEPINITETNVTWRSDDESIATVSSVGVVTARGEGTTVIRASVLIGIGDEAIEDTCTVTVEDGYVGDKHSVTGKVILVETYADYSDLSAVLRNEYGYPLQSTIVEEMRGYAFYDVKPGKYYISIFGTTHSGFMPITITDKDVVVDDLTISDRYNLSLTVTSLDDGFYLSDYTFFGMNGTSPTDESPYGVVRLSTSADSNLGGVKTLPWKVSGYTTSNRYIGEFGIDRIRLGDTNITELIIPYGVTMIESLGPLNTSASNNYNTSLLKVTIPSSVESLPSALPINLSTVIFEEGSPFMIDNDGWICREGEHVVLIPAFVGEDPVLVEGISFSETSGTSDVGERFTIDVTFDPVDAWNKNLIWTSSDQAVASVSASGMITALSKGTTTITATSVDGGHSATYDLLVNEIAMADIFFEDSEGTIHLGEKIVLMPRVDPINATERALTWTSSEEGVATVTQDGAVTAKGEGQATITVASVSDPSIKDSFVITVIPASTGNAVTLGTDGRGYVNAMVNGVDFNGGYVSSTDVLVLRYEEEANYEFVEWTVTYGGVTDYYDTYSVRLTGISDDTDIVAHSIYYSLSRFPVEIIDMNTPIITDDLQLNWTFGTGIVNAASMNWQGHSSAPLIVGDYAYLRVVDKIHKVDLASGISVATAPSVSSTAFFHFVGYAHGLIFDGETHRVYDTDLNYVMDFDANSQEVFPGGEYTYVSHSEFINGVRKSVLSKYTADFSQKLWETNIDGVYVPMQSTQFIILDDYIYWLSYNSEDRIFNSLDIATGTIRNSVVLTGIQEYKLDDGWLTTDGTRLYISGYSQGLFDESGTFNSKVAYATIDNGQFYDVSYIDLGTSTAASSQFIVYNDRGYIAAGKYFFVFDKTASGFELAYRAEISRTHGGIVMSTSNVDIDGNVYIYLLPYQATGGAALYIYSDHPGQTEVNVRVYSNLIQNQFGSQAVRAGPNGELLWYNDTGLVFSVSASSISGKDYRFFIKDGNNGTWVTASGSTLENALLSLNDPRIMLSNGTLMMGTEKAYIYGWSEKLDRWEPITDDRYAAYAVSVSRPNATEPWYNTDDGGKTLGNTIKELLSVHMTSGTSFTSVLPNSTLVGIALDVDAVYLLKNDRMQITAVTDPVADVDSRVVWSSSNTSVATVDQNGNIKAMGKGVVAITATSYSDPSISATCYVTVSEYLADVSILSISIDVTSTAMRINGTLEITATILPDNATDTGVIWKSSNTRVATVDQNGNVRAIGVGTAVITAMSKWNPLVEVSCEVTVVADPVTSISVSGVSLDRSNASIEWGNTLQLTATLEPGNATNKSVRWSSSNTGVATVSSNGIITAVSAGTATITVTTVDGGRAATCTVTITMPSSVIVDSVDHSQGVETILNNGGNGRSESISDVPTSNSNGVAVVDSNRVAEIVRQIERADKMSGSNTLTSAVNIDAGNADTIRIANAKSLADANASLRIESKDGTIEITNNALKGMASSTGDLVIELKERDRSDLSDAQRSKVGENDLVITATATLGSTQVHELGGKVKVSIPYALKSGETVDGLRLWYLGDDGTMEEMDFQYINGNVVFETDHFSEFVISHASSASGDDGSDNTMLIIAAIAIIAIVALAAVLIIRRSKATP